MLYFCNFSLQVIKQNFSYWGFDCWCDLFFDFKETITSFKLESFAYFVKYTSVDNVAEDLPYDTLPLRRLVDGNSF